MHEFCSVAVACTTKNNKKHLRLHNNCNRVYWVDWVDFGNLSAICGFSLEFLKTISLYRYAIYNIKMFCSFRFSFLSNTMRHTQTHKHTQYRTDGRCQSVPEFHRLNCMRWNAAARCLDAASLPRFQFSLLFLQTSILDPPIESIFFHFLYLFQFLSHCFLAIGFTYSPFGYHAMHIAHSWNSTHIDCWHWCCCCCCCHCQFYEWIISQSESI